MNLLFTEVNNGYFEKNILHVSVKIFLLNKIILLSDPGVGCVYFHQRTIVKLEQIRNSKGIRDKKKGSDFIRKLTYLSREMKTIAVY